MVLCTGFCNNFQSLASLILKGSGIMYRYLSYYEVSYQWFPFCFLFSNLCLKRGYAALLVNYQLKNDRNRSKDWFLSKAFFYNNFNKRLHLFWKDEVSFLDFFAEVFWRWLTLFSWLNCRLFCCLLQCLLKCWRWPRSLCENQSGFLWRRRNSPLRVSSSSTSM